MHIKTPLLILACPHRGFTEHRMEQEGRPRQATSLVHSLNGILMKLFLIYGWESTTYEGRTEL